MAGGQVGSEISRGITMADQMRNMLPSQRTPEVINGDWLKALNELSWNSDNFLGELFSNTSSKIEKDSKGNFTFTPTSEGILSIYDNGTSFAEVGQYIFGVPIAWFATKFAQESYMQDVAGAVGFKAELMQLNKTIEDYMNLMMMMQLYPSEPGVDTVKMKKELDEYKAGFDKISSDLEKLADENYTLSRRNGMLQNVYDGLYKTMAKGPKATLEYLTNVMGLAHDMEPTNSTSPPAATAYNNSAAPGTA